MASMSRTSLRNEVKRLGRVGSNVAPSVLDAWLYEAVKKLQNDIKWLEQTRYYYVREYFTIGTNEGFGVRLTAATGTLNVVGLDTAFVEKSGATVADALSTALIAMATGSAVTWSTANFKFTVDISSNASTGMYVGPPSYDTTAIYDASYKLFGLTAETSVDAQTYTGSISPWCTSEYPLPDDFLYLKEAKYDDRSYPLIPTIYKSRDDATGTPSHIYIRGDMFGVVPQPLTGGKIIQFDYYYLPIEFAADATLHPFPEIFNYALIYYAIFLYKQNQDDTAGELKFRAKYEEEKIKASQRKQARVGGAIDLFEKQSMDFDPRRFNLR